MTTDNDPRIEFIAKRDIAPGEEILTHYMKGKCDLVFNDAGTFFRDEDTIRKSVDSAKMNMNEMKLPSSTETNLDPRDPWLR
jgi:hypothetical protein|tara:strand:+ start:834 stop:1079 length:246 start_codon:yes stop_codon:yes gene_type:complete